MISRLRPIILSALVFLLVLATGGVFINLFESRRSDEKRQMVKEIGTAQAHLLERQLDHSLSSTFALASILGQSGRIDNFDALAAEMIGSYGGISSLQLAPNGVVRQIYPLAGNEEAIGHDLLKDSRRRTEALAAIESRQLTLAGPFKLIQGGEAVIGRLPVFVPHEAGDERFWGFTIALIHLRDLLEVSNLTRLVEDGYNYELSRTDPDSGTRAVFARSTQADLENTIPFEIEVPNGRWTLAIAPGVGWQSSSFLPVKIGLLFLVSALIASFTLSLARRPQILRREVEFRTQEFVQANRALGVEIVERKRTEGALRESKENLQRLLETTKAIPWEANAKSWQFTYVGPQAVKLLGYPVNEWYQKDFWTTRIHPEDRESAVDFCLMSSKSCKDYDFEYRMVALDGGVVWVHDLVSCECVDGTPEKLRGFMVDITDRKRAELFLAAQNRVLEMLAKGRSLGDVLVELTRTIERQNRAGIICSILLMDSDGIHLRHGSGPNLPDEYREAIDGIAIGPEVGSCGTAAYRRDRVVVTDIASDPLWADYRDLALRFNLRSCWSEPILSESGQVLGTFALYYNQPYHPSDKELDIVAKAASLAGVAIEHTKANEALEESRIALRRNHKEIQELAGKLLSAQEEERRRLARELHDDFTQRLAVVAIDVGKLEQQLQSAPALVLKKLKETKDRIVKLSEDTHRISRQLHPSILDDLGLADAIASECMRFKDSEGISVMFKSENIPEGLSKEKSLCLYRVTQESLRNIAKHSRAKKAHVKLTGAKGDFILSVRDSGIGFSRIGVRGKAGLGLASMEERVRLIQGHLSIRTKPGKGTIIEVRVPLSEEINETTTRAIG